VISELLKNVVEERDIRTLPIEVAETIPASWCHAPDMLQWERKHIFGRRGRL